MLGGATIGGAIVTFTLAGCATVPARLAVRDARAAAAVKRIAVMPFFIANTLSVDIDVPPSGASDEAFSGALIWAFKKKHRNYAREFAAKAEQVLGKRYTFIYGETVERKLKEYGNYAGYVEAADRNQRTGFSVADALKAGKALGADAVMLGSYSYADNPELSSYFNEAISIRVLDVNSGKVIWGASSRQSDSAGSIFEKILEKIRVEGP